MHELSICRSLLREIAAVAMAHKATRVRRAVVSVGLLSCVDPDLLMRAFMAGRSGTVADRAILEVERTPVRLRCEACGACTEGTPNLLRCRCCGDAKVQLESGNELLLRQVDLELTEVE
ncbi:MAG TPA: hydrogenase maturation nickel metallochaperone HypA [Rhodopila sp.]|nr:hydrogenase maturation nickel metallochaperone HypA [Rhodopila sp.]